MIFKDEYAYNTSYLYYTYFFNIFGYIMVTQKLQYCKKHRFFHKFYLLN